MAKSYHWEGPSRELAELHALNSKARWNSLFRIIGLPHDLSHLVEWLLIGVSIMAAAATSALRFVQGLPIGARVFFTLGAAVVFLTLCTGLMRLVRRVASRLRGRSPAPGTDTASDAGDLRANPGNQCQHTSQWLSSKVVDWHLRGLDKAEHNFGFSVELSNYTYGEIRPLACTGYLSVAGNECLTSPILRAAPDMISPGKHVVLNFRQAVSGDLAAMIVSTLKGNSPFAVSASDVKIVVKVKDIETGSRIVHVPIGMSYQILSLQETSYWRHSDDHR